MVRRVNRRRATLIVIAVLIILAYYLFTSKSETSVKLICSETDQSDCYPELFVPTKEWQTIRPGQILPAGLEYQLDLEADSKRARLLDPSKEAKQKAGLSRRPIEESESNKVVKYAVTEEDTEDPDIRALKKAAGNSNTEMEIKEALDQISKSFNNFDETQLINALDSLTEHSHNLKDGILISEPHNFDNLLYLATEPHYNDKIKELALRTIAQALRHNPKALANVNASSTLGKLFKLLNSETNKVLQKRILGVISSIVQSKETTSIFNQLGGEDKILASLPSLGDDSKVRALEILEDVKNLSSTNEKRSLDDESKIFEALQNIFIGDKVRDEHAIEKLFDKLVQLKQDNKNLKQKPEFLQWLSNEVETGKLSKREQGLNNDLHDKLLEARHVVFGNPNALRKAMADEF